jgi:hypothetical protein
MSTKPLSLPGSFAWRSEDLAHDKISLPASLLSFLHDAIGSRPGAEEASPLVLRATPLAPVADAALPEVFGGVGEFTAPENW